MITRAVANPSLDWPAEHLIEPQRGKLDERFLRFKTSPSHRSLPFYPLGGKPFSACLFIPSSDYYGNGGGRAISVTKRCRGRNKCSWAFCPPTWHCLWRLRLCPPSRCEHHRRWWARDTRQQVRLVHAYMAVLQVYQADLLKELDKGEGFNAKDISELRKTADLSRHQGDHPSHLSVYGSSGGSGEASLVDPVGYQRPQQGLPSGRSAIIFWPFRWRCWLCRRQAPGGGEADGGIPAVSLSPLASSWGCWVRAAPAAY